MYLELLRDVLLNRHYQNPSGPPLALHSIQQLRLRLQSQMEPWLEQHPQAPEAALVRSILHESDLVFQVFIQQNQPQALVLQGPSGLNHVRNCVEQLLRDSIPGDLVECGIWRGGVTIFMRGLLKFYGDHQRRVWGLDSFQGLPCPELERHPLDFLSYQVLLEIGGFATSREQVENNFRLFDLWDDQVRLLPGWFCDSLPQWDIPPIALLRLDADFYDSTKPLLDSLYPKLSPGGYLIIDDYGITNMQARQAVDDYRREHHIDEPIQAVNQQVVYWRKP